MLPVSIPTKHAMARLCNWLPGSVQATVGSTSEAGHWSTYDKVELQHLLVYYVLQNCRQAGACSGVGSCTSAGRCTSCFPEAGGGSALKASSLLSCLLALKQLNHPNFSFLAALVSTDPATAGERLDPSLQGACTTQPGPICSAT